MSDQKRSVVAVHGVGAGSDADRVGFSLELARLVETSSRRVTLVGRLPDESVCRRLDAPEQLRVDTRSPPAITSSPLKVLVALLV